MGIPMLFQIAVQSRLERAKVTLEDFPVFHVFGLPRRLET